jgi:hypothetical protein
MSDDFPRSPADGTHIFDDFHSNSAVTDGLVGNLNWEMVTLGNASVPSFVGSQNGIMRITTAATADGDGEAFTLEPDGLVLSGTNQIVRCRVRYPAASQIATNNFRIGFSDSVTTTEPAVGVWIDSDGGLLSFDCANTTTDVTKAVTGIPTLTGGTTMVIGTWYDLELRMSDTNANGGPATIQCFVDGYPAGTIENVLLASDETMEFSILHWQDSGGALAALLDIDYYEAWLPRN